MSLREHEARRVRSERFQHAVDVLVAHRAEHDGRRRGVQIGQIGGECFRSRGIVRRVEQDAAPGWQRQLLKPRRPCDLREAADDRRGIDRQAIAGAFESAAPSARLPSMSQPGQISAGQETRMHGRYGYREVTVAAVAYGVIFGAIMNAAITYMGLKIGFTLGGGSIAAVVGFGVLRGILRRGSILETNIG